MVTDCHFLFILICQYFLFDTFGCVLERFFLESIVYLEDVKTVELFYLQAQMLISQVVAWTFAFSLFR